MNICSGIDVIATAADHMPSPGFRYCNASPANDT